MSLAAHNRFDAKYGRRTADGTAHGCHERRVAVEFEQPAEPQAQEYRAAHHDGVGHYGGQANGGHVGESEAETVEHNARAEYLLCAELNARHHVSGSLLRRLLA